MRGNPRARGRVGECQKSRTASKVANGPMLAELAELKTENEQLRRDRGETRAAIQPHTETQHDGVQYHTPPSSHTAVLLPMGVRLTSYHTLFAFTRRLHHTPSPSRINRLHALCLLHALVTFTRQSPSRACPLHAPSPSHALGLRTRLHRQPQHHLLQPPPQHVCGCFSPRFRPRPCSRHS